MIYKINKIEQKTSAKGSTYWVADFEADGKVLNASSFDLLGKNIGDTVDGEIITNGAYTNFKIKKEVKSGGFGGAGVKVAQERKAEMIKEAQERKTESIAYFNSVNSAIAILSVQKPSNVEETKKILAYWRDWFLDEYRKYEASDYQDKHNAI